MVLSRVKAVVSLKVYMPVYLFSEQSGAGAKQINCVITHSIRGSHSQRFGRGEVAVDGRNELVATIGRQIETRHSSRVHMIQKLTDCGKTGI
jgi:hypothetical protein